MNFRRFSSGLLLFVFICSVVFSVSASASALNLVEIDLPSYITDAVFNDDETVTVTYDLPMQPYSDIYACIDSEWEYYDWTRDNPVYICDQYLDGATEYRIDSYLLGYSSSGFNCIDISDIKSGSYFDITMSYHMFYTSDEQISQPTLQAVWYNENMEQIATTSYLQEWTSVNTDGSYYTSEFIYSDTVTFTVPSGSSYVSFLHMTGNQAHQGQFEDYWQFDYITFKADLSVFEYDSRTQQAVKEKLDDIKAEEEKQTGLLGNIVSGIMELPTKIVNGIKGAITDLFVPDEQSIVDMKDDWEQLLSDRLGAVYESSKIIDDWAAAFSVRDTISSLEFPELTVNLAGSDFTFGGWNVNLVPEGFADIISTLKVIINIVCTLAFINAMRKRLEGILH